MISIIVQYNFAGWIVDDSISSISFLQSYRHLPVLEFSYSNSFDTDNVLDIISTICKVENGLTILDTLFSACCWPYLGTRVYNYMLSALSQRESYTQLNSNLKTYKITGVISSYFTKEIFQVGKTISTIDLINISL